MRAGSRPFRTDTCSRCSVHSAHARDPDSLGIKAIRATDAKEVGVGNPAEERAVARIKAGYLKNSTSV